MLSGTGTCKAVLSGDTIVLVGSARESQSAPEMQLTLSNVLAPKIGRYENTVDEPFGWESREFLRKLAIGKTIKFKVDYQRKDKSGNARSFGTLYCIDFPSVSINQLVLRSGLGSFYEEANGGNSLEIETLREAVTLASTSKLGIYDDEAGKAAFSRAVIYNTPQNEAQNVLSSWKTSHLRGIVEQVINGSTLRVLVTSQSPMRMLVVHLAGIQCPKTPAANSAAPSSNGAPSPAAAPSTGSASTSGKPSWGAKAAQTNGASTATTSPAPVAPQVSPLEAASGVEAKLFMEARALNRDVLVTLQPASSTDKFGNIFARVDLAPAGSASDLTASVASVVDAAYELVRGGYARLVDFSAEFTSVAHIAGLRAAERQAKADHLRLWKDYSAPKIASLGALSASGLTEFNAKVVEVVSADTLSVVTGPGAPELRISLASLRAPKLARRGSDEKDAPFAIEAKEFMRKALVGRDVRVKVDYSRPKQGTEPADRVYASVFLTTRKGDEFNAAVPLLQEGLAEVMRHRNDEPRAEQYDELLAAEEQAKLAKKNIFGSKPAPVHRVNDLSLDASKAKAHFPFLQRSKTMKGCVEALLSANRLKVHIPNEHCTITFCVAGIRCPATARPASKTADGKQRPAVAAEPLGDAALRYVRESLLQRTVELEVDDVDRTGAMLGSLYVGEGGARKLVGADLLRQGLAFGIRPVVERVRDASALLAAEKEAKDAKRGVWEHYTEPVLAEDDADVDESTPEQSAGAPTGTGLSAPSSTPTLVNQVHTTSTFDSLKESVGTVTEIIDANTFFLSFAVDKAKLQAIKLYLASLSEAFGTQGAPVPNSNKKGTVVAALAKRPEDKGQAWYRARVEGRAVDAAKNVPLKSASGFDLYDAVLIDYGTRVQVSVQQMRPIDNMSLDAIPALAKESTLAFLRSPALSTEYGPDAAQLLSDLAYNEELKVVVIPNLGPLNETKLHVVLRREGDDASVNEILIDEGLSRLSANDTKRSKRKNVQVEFIGKLEKLQLKAKKERIAMWQYGDVGDSEEDKRK
jgi:staphylococcal nuclease domain-containing protein 1